jgi:hypothetical protein
VNSDDMLTELEKLLRSGLEVGGRPEVIKCGPEAFRQIRAAALRAAINPAEDPGSGLRVFGMPVIIDLELPPETVVMLDYGTLPGRKR